MLHVTLNCIRSSLLAHLEGKTSNLIDPSVKETDVVAITQDKVKTLCHEAHSLPVLHLLGVFLSLFYSHSHATAGIPRAFPPTPFPLAHIFSLKLASTATSKGPSVVHAQAVRVITHSLLPD